MHHHSLSEQHSVSSPWPICVLVSYTHCFSIDVQKDTWAQHRAGIVQLWHWRTNSGRSALCEASPRGVVLFYFSNVHGVQLYEIEHSPTVCMLFAWLISEAMKPHSLMSLRTYHQRTGVLMDSSMHHPRVVDLLDNQQWSSYHFVGLSSYCVIDDNAFHVQHRQTRQRIITSNRAQWQTDSRRTEVTLTFHPFCAARTVQSWR